MSKKTSSSSTVNTNTITPNDKPTVTPKAKNVCDNCNIERCRYNNQLEVYLCSDCKLLDKYTLIYKTYALSEYMLKIEDLISCPSYEKWVQQYRSMCTLYKLTDVQRVFCEKYNIENNPEIITETINAIKNDHRLRLQEKRSKRKIMEEYKCKMRKSKLIAKLSAYGLTLRSDSSLCQGYIDGTIKNKSKKDIAIRMCQMKFLFDYCDMDRLMIQAYDNQRAERKAGYYPDCTQVEEAEDIYLSESGGYPSTWPWLDNIII